MPIFTALGLLIMIPAIVAAVQEGKDPAVRSTAWSAAILGGIVAAHPHIGLLYNHIHGVWWKVLCAALAVLGIILVVKLRNQVVGTCLACGGVLLALGAFGAIRGSL